MSEEQQVNVVWEGKFLRMVTQGRWEYVQRTNITGIVGIIAVTDDNKLILVEQYRTPVGKQVIELPAGLVGDVPGQESEAMEVAAHRELEEETGYQAQRLEEVFSGVASAGLSSERMTFFLATGLKKVGDGGGDHTEDIIVHEVPVDEVLQWVTDCQKEGMEVDLKVISALHFARR